jgi:hypothetical protein
LQVFLRLSEAAFSFGAAEGHAAMAGDVAHVLAVGEVEIDERGEVIQWYVLA